MSTFTIRVEHLPILGTEQVVDRASMEVMIRALPIEWVRVKLTDSFYYAPSWNGCVKAIEYLKTKVPKYYTDKFDCENAAGWFRHKMAEVFGVNIMAEVEGWAMLPLEVNPNILVKRRHGWSLFTEGQYFYQMESQTGVIMDIDDPTYVPDEICMG